MQFGINRKFVRRAHLLVVLFASACAALSTAHCPAGEVLIADRGSHSVFRYSESGTLLGTLIDGMTDTHLDGPIGLAISPDRTKLFVSSFSGKVTRYDYSYATHSATNPFDFPTAGLAAPNAMRIGPDGTTLYVSNLGGGVSHFNFDGSSAGSNLTRPDGSQTSFTGLVYNPEGKLLVGVFNDNQGNGAVAVGNLATNELSEFVAGSPALAGASGVLVHRNDLYVSGMFAGKILRYNATTGAPDPLFEVAGLEFPQGLMLSPDLNGFFVGMLGAVNGAGRIERYGYDGISLGTFASPSPEQGGFGEATAMLITIPEPTRGDFNLDGNFTSADIAMMLKALTDLDSYKRAKEISEADLLVIGDYNNSNSVTNSDIQGLLNALSVTGGSLAAVPEPNAAILAGIALTAYVVAFRRQLPSIRGTLKSLRQ
jgi:sugar lactone lactonase YvrE